MIFFLKKHKFYSIPYGCAETLALKIFLNEREHLEKTLGGKIKATKIHHYGSGYVDYIVYTLKEKEGVK